MTSLPQASCFLLTLFRVCTEIRKQNSWTFQGLHIFFRIRFFADSVSANTAYTQDFFPDWECKHISPSSSLFLPDFSSAYCLCRLLSFLPFRISTLQGFTYGCIRFVLHVLEQTTMVALPLNTALHFVYYYTSIQ